jgi:putative heme degradation protein
MGSPKFAVDATASPIITISMKVSSGAWAQLFFVTDTDSRYDEAKSLRFRIQGDGEFHDYVLDMSAVQGWQGAITQLRLDPEEPANVEIDYIRIVGR